MSKTEQLCIVRVGIDDFVLSLTDGARLLQILGKATLVERDYMSPPNFVPRQSEPSLSLEIIKRSQLKEAAARPVRRPLLLPPPRAD